MQPGKPYNRLTDTVTPDNCDREPVHTPGCINPHGTLLTCSWEEGVILQCATNVGLVTDKKPAELLN